MFQMNGDTIVNALRVQVVHYTIESSLFDIVFVAIIRFLFLIMFYGIFSINHWIVIAVNTDYAAESDIVPSILMHFVSFTVDYNWFVLIFNWKSLLLRRK